MNFKIRLTTNRSLSSFHNFFQLSETALYSQNFNLLILCSQKRAKLTKLSDEETADSEKSSHDLLACESMFSLPRPISTELFHLWASSSKFRAPYFPKWPTVRCFSSTFDCLFVPRGGVFAAHLFSQPRISRGSMTSAMKNGLSTNSGQLRQRCFVYQKGDIFLGENRRGRRETKAVGIKR